MRIIPINTAEGLCRCIKAGYFKMGWTNFTREIAGAKDGFTATAIMSIYDNGGQEEGCDDRMDGQEQDG